MAAYLQKNAQLNPVLDSKGKIGELTVWVNDKMVATKGFLAFPARQNVLEAIQKEIG